MKDIVIVGSGGFAREVRWLIDECNNGQWQILGWISKEQKGTIIAGLPVLGDDEWLLNYDKPIDVVVAVGSGNLRKKIVSVLKKNNNISFPSIVSTTSKISNSVCLGQGAIVTSNCILTVNIKIGEFFLCNLSSTVGHDCKFGDYVTLNPGVNISGNVNLGECVTFGTGSCIIERMSVGDNSIIGAGATVVKNIPSNCTAVGTPAKIIKDNNGKE